NVLYFVDDVLGQRLYAFQAQDVVRARRAVRNDFATLDVLALEHRHLAPLRNQYFIVRAAVERIHAICRRDDQAALALGFLAEADGARNLRQDGRLFRFARFEEVGNTRQTTGDVAGLRTFLRDTRDNVTDLDL